ncbi:MAG: hypothetical protein QOF66_4975 [Mycobacterium sp.]|jgi:hypothetical protein|nr:hypothetical protein [Mycobacterium sp.]MDT5056609.1 hypothetical protein [Mycobacterium sp.]MDT5229993.1 hypothetical protein [Mycobacterium sp.]
MKIVPTRIEQQINRVDRTRSLMIGISCGLLALWSIYRLLWSLYLAMTYNFLFGSPTAPKRREQRGLWAQLGNLVGARVLARIGLILRP